MPEEREITNRRATMPALTPDSSGQSAGPDTASWSVWLEDGDPREPETTAQQPVDLEKTQYLSMDPRRLQVEDPMAPLAADARRRTLSMRRRQRILTRAMLAGGLAAVLAIVAGVIWISMRDSGTTAQPQTVASSAGFSGDASATGAWCAPSENADRLVSAEDGDPSTGAGVILHLEYAWYVLRDPIAVRGMLSPDARVASEAATRDAIASIPAGTQHCVAVAALGVDRWSVKIDEKHTDGTLVSWEQVVTTTVRDGRALITSIVSSGG